MLIDHTNFEAKYFIIFWKLWVNLNFRKPDSGKYKIVSEVYFGIQVVQGFLSSRNVRS